MRVMILGVACLMMVSLSIGIFLHEEPDQIKQPTPNDQNLTNTENKQERLQPIYVDENIGYSLQNDELNITFNQGEDWVKVPIDNEQFLHGNGRNLLENSYIISKEQIAFFYLAEAYDHEQSNTLLVTYSFDQGGTWEEAVVAETYPYIDFKKVDFLSDQFGYVIVTGERVVSQEASYIYMTNDGGENWVLANRPDTTNLIYNGGFIDELTGFLSVGIINPVQPELHVTQDGGNTWTEATIHVPEEYSEIFLIAEMPFKEADELIVRVNQGPNGDYKGGKVKAKFVSDDEGITWHFVEEVEQDE